MSNRNAAEIAAMCKLSHQVRQLIGRFASDSRANAAVEFSFIVPLMLTMFFGTVEFSSGVAVNRKVTLAARNMSDLVSQSSTVTDTDLTNFTTTAKAIMTPFGASPLNSTVTELYVDPATLQGKVIWSKGSAARGAGSTVSLPTALQVGGTYLIFSEVNYKYVPAVGYVMAKAGITLSDFTYTRPRLSLCVLYGTQACGT
jgi:Flp pilus assembly protein TadG